MLTLLLLLALPSVGASRCDSAVGDPCIPEANTAFAPTEAFLELSSVQCSTRVCLVKGLDGNPHKVNGVHPDCPGDDDCVDQADVDRFAYCSCRCSAPVGSGLPTCDCPSGFHCEEILQAGGAGIIGDYCVRNE